MVSSLMKYLKDSRITLSLVVSLVGAGCSSPDTNDPAMTSGSSTDSTPSTTNSTSDASRSGSQASTSGATTSSISGTTSPGTSTDTNSTSTSSEVPVPTFYEVQGILLSSCVLVSCHSPLYNQPNLSNYDSEAMLHERLLSYQVKNCNNANFVKPGEPENSAVLKVVNHGCGDFIMPPLCEDPCLDPASFASLEAWIKAGAPAD